MRFLSVYDFWRFDCCDLILGFGFVLWILLLGYLWCLCVFSLVFVDLVYFSDFGFEFRVLRVDVLRRLCFEACGYIVVVGLHALFLCLDLSCWAVGPWV